MRMTNLSQGDKIVWCDGGRVETVREVCNRGVYLVGLTGLFSQRDIEKLWMRIEE